VIVVPSCPFVLQRNISFTHFRSHVAHPFFPTQFQRDATRTNPPTDPETSPSFQGVNSQFCFEFSIGPSLACFLYRIGCCLYHRCKLCKCWFWYVLILFPSLFVVGLKSHACRPKQFWVRYRGLFVQGSMNVFHVVDSITMFVTIISHFSHYPIISLFWSL